MAADLAASTCEWLHLIERFDRTGGWAGVGIASCAAWLSWTCSVSPSTAREYVRVARALPGLPLIDQEFAAGRLSYSKVRAMVKVADEVDEAVLLQQARAQTVSQLERTVRAFRRGDGWDQERLRFASWHWDDDGMLSLSARLPADEGALLVAALEKARDDIELPPAGSSCGSRVRPTDEPQEQARLTGGSALAVARSDMLVALAERALGAEEVDSSGDDRHLVVVHADLDQLTDGADGTVATEDPDGPDSHEGPDSPDGTDSAPSDHGEIHDGVAGVGPAPDAAAPAGPGAAAAPGPRAATDDGGPFPAAPRCHVQNGPGLTRRTARRLACDASLVAVLHNVGEGEPLRVGRKTRSISAAQRRALRVRDGGCRFPGCHRRSYLEAHHVRPWSLFGRTDLDNLVLVCRFHHMLVHEAGYRVAAHERRGWQFYDPRGTAIPPAPPLPGRRGATARQADVAGTPGGRSTSGGTQVGVDPLRLTPGWAGEPFHLVETVGALASSPRH